MATDLTNIKVGDKLALRERTGWDNRFAIDHRILVVERVTPTQVCCRDARGFIGEWRFNRRTGRRVGGHSLLDEAIIATDELLQRHNDQMSNAGRLRSAESDLADLFGKHPHQLKLSLEQTEALAKAWLEVKALHKQPCDEVVA